MGGTPDVIVVGSGCTGAMAAQTLVDSGRSVTMLDVGHRDTRYVDAIPDGDFLTLRRSDSTQHRYLLGDDFEGIPSSRLGAGAQLTPPRQHMIRDVERLLPLASPSFHAIESLALGGLGTGWGVGCCVFSEAELERVGLDVHAMNTGYALVRDRIGISGTIDDATPYTTGSLGGLLPPTELDPNSERIFQSYAAKRGRLNRRGFFLGRPALALLTQDRDGRRASAYDEMDFYSDRQRSAYRPWMTIERLVGNDRFEYRNNVLVTRYREDRNGVEVHAQRADTGESVVCRAPQVLLAAGVLGTARIVLRSNNTEHSESTEHRLPLICNPYCYIPCLQPSLLGKVSEAPRTGFAQLSLFHDPDGRHADVAMGSVYSYRSLLLYRLMKETPLNYVDGRIVMQYLQSAISIVGIHQPEGPSDTKYVTLEHDETSMTGDRLAVTYRWSDSEQSQFARRERQFMSALRTLGCYPLKRVKPPVGGSIHYAGTLPYSVDERPFSLATDGRLHRTRRVYVADGSGFRFLPAKGLTLTLMANAHRTACAMLRNET